MSPAEFMKKIGQRIRKLREEKGAKLNPLAQTRAQMGRAYSQSHLARDSQMAKGKREIDVSFTKQQLANYEQGTRTPSPWDAAGLAKLLDASPAYVLCLEDQGQPILTAAEVVMLKDFRTLPVEKRADFCVRICELAEAYRSRHEKIADQGITLDNTDSSGKGRQPDLPDLSEPDSGPNPFEELVAIHGEETALRLVRELIQPHVARNKRKPVGDTPGTSKQPKHDKTAPTRNADSNGFDQ